MIMASVMIGKTSPAHWPLPEWEASEAAEQKNQNCDPHNKARNGIQEGQTCHQKAGR